jgi:ABC-type polysaccharide/polyol phosphate export permease
MDGKYLLYAAAFCLITILLGLWMFRKNEDKFILYI